MIYFIQSGSNGAIKIGYTKNMDSLQKRIPHLQNGNPQELNLLYTCEGKKEDEARYHQKFKKDKLKGEWFKPSQELISYIHSLYSTPLSTQLPQTSLLPICLDKILKQTEITYIERALAESNGIQRRACDLLGINERSLWHRIKKHGIKIIKKT